MSCFVAVVLAVAVVVADGMAATVAMAAAAAPVALSFVFGHPFRFRALPLSFSLEAPRFRC